MQIHRDDFCSRTIRHPSPHTWRIWRLSLFFVLTNQKTLESQKGARSNKFETSATAMHQRSSVIKFGGTFAEVCKALVEQDLPLVVQMAEFQTFVTATCALFIFPTCMVKTELQLLGTLIRPPHASCIPQFEY